MPDYINNKVDGDLMEASDLEAIETASATKANKITSATNGNVIEQDASGDLVDSGVATSNLATLSGANPFTGLVTLTGLEINDTSSDHQYVLAVSELTADRIVTLPLLTGGDTLTFNDFAATLTNKTFNLSSNTLSGTTALFNTALSDDDFLTLAGSESPTNKTIDLTDNTLTGTTAEFNAALSDNTSFITTSSSAQEVGGAFGVGITPTAQFHVSGSIGTQSVTGDTVAEEVAIFQPDASFGWNGRLRILGTKVGGDNSIMLLSDASGDVGLSLGTKDGGVAAARLTIDVDGNTNIIGTLSENSTNVALSGANSDITGLSGFTGTGTLDYYDEETFTPTLQDDSLSDAEGQTYTLQIGAYTRIGNRCFFNISLNVSSLGTLTTSEGAKIAGLPFTAGGAAGTSHSCAVGFGNSLNITAGVSTSGTIGTGQSYVALFLWDTAAGPTTMTISEFSAGGIIRVSGQYEVA